MATEFHSFTDDALDVWIANKLGWRVAFEKPTPKHAYAKWIVYRPDGKRVGLPAPKDADVCRLLLTYAPKHTASVDAALTLPKRAGCKLRMVVRGDAAVAAYEEWIFSYRGKSTPDKLARAISEAWCAMREGERTVDSGTS